MFNTIFVKSNEYAKERMDSLAYTTDVLLQGHKQMVLPLWIGIKSEAEWLLPVEPLISISGKNVIVKRNAAKPNWPGTIKERWAEDDFQIAIQGTFVHPDINTYPEKDVEKFIRYMKYKEALHVKNELFASLNISRIVIDNYSLPFTKGENVQNYFINAYSDMDYELFIDTANV